MFSYTVNSSGEHFFFICFFFVLWFECFASMYFVHHMDEGALEA